MVVVGEPVAGLNFFLNNKKSIKKIKAINGWMDNKHLKGRIKLRNVIKSLIALLFIAILRKTV